MKLVCKYERIVTALGDAVRDAAEVGDREIEGKLRDLQAVAIDRLYTASDRLPVRQVPRGDATYGEEAG
jgi:hypothetical protein